MREKIILDLLWKEFPETGYNSCERNRMTKQKYKTTDLVFDISAGLVVFLVALPLCLGVALASGVPLISGILTGILGGILVGLLSGSSLAVSGPAAGLTVIVLSALQELGSFPAFLTSVILAGGMQIIFSAVRAGSLGNFFPASVIQGMLASIGIVLILKQIPHALGFDLDFEGDFEFFQADGHNTFTEIIYAFSEAHAGAVALSFCSLVVLVFWEKVQRRWGGTLRFIPGALMVVVLGSIVNAAWFEGTATLGLQVEHLVQIPEIHSWDSLIKSLEFPDFRLIQSSEIWLLALTIAVVASLETLLSVDASDKLDPRKRITPLNRELFAQGVGNLFCGLLGGLPLTAVIVRSSANVAAGAKSKVATIVHGLLLLLSVLFFSSLLNRIPLSILAAILIHVGFKLTKPSIFVNLWRKGSSQLVPFVVTIVSVLLSDLLIGIGIGLVVGISFVILSNYRSAIVFVQDEDHYLVRFRKDVTFLNKSKLKEILYSIPENSYLMIDSSEAAFVDYDIFDTVEDFKELAIHRNIQLEIRKGALTLV